MVEKLIIVSVHVRYFSFFSFLGRGARQYHCFSSEGKLLFQLSKDHSFHTGFYAHAGYCHICHSMYLMQNFVDGWENDQYQMKILPVMNMSPLKMTNTELKEVWMTTARDVLSWILCWWVFLWSRVPENTIMMVIQSR